MASKQKYGSTCYLAIAMNESCTHKKQCANSCNQWRITVGMTGVHRTGQHFVFKIEVGNILNVIGEEG